MKIGRIGYINCDPVYGAIDRGVLALPHGGELVTGTPAELNDLLVAGELDVSVISAIEYARHAKDLVLLPELAISCDGPVRSVALFSRRTVRQLDGRTVLLAGLPHDAVLVIGDAALKLAAAGTYQHRYDLGEQWKRWTTLPFVFAVWASRRGVGFSQAHKALLASRTWGLAHLDELAAEASRKTGVSRAVCREYLGGLDYAFTDRHRTALTDFLRRVGVPQFIQVA